MSKEDFDIVSVITTTRISLLVRTMYLLLEHRARQLDKEEEIPKLFLPPETLKQLDEILASIDR